MLFLQLLSNPLSRDSDFFLENIDCSFKDQRIGQITTLPSICDEELLLSKFSIQDQET